MNGALFFLFSRSFANLVLFRLRRLRQPKYLAGAVAGGFYFYFYFYRFLFHGAGLAKPAPFAAPDPATADLGALLFAAVIIVFSWLWPSSRAALHFSEAEIAWLFPAPLDRPALIRFKLLKTQFALLFLSFFMTLVSGRFSQGAPAWIHLAGWWIVFLTLQMHRLGASFALQRLTERGLADGRRRALVLLLVGALLVAGYFWQRALPEVPSFNGLPKATDWTDWLQALAHAGPAPYLLWPFRAIIAPWASPDLPSFLRALPAALGLLALHYWWVIRSHVSFEEASLVLSQKIAALIAARRGGDRRVTLAPRAAQRPLFRLRPQGWEPWAMVWKYTLASGGWRSYRAWGLAGGVLLAGAAGLAWDGRWPWAQMLVLVLGVVVFMLVILVNAQGGAQAVRRDLGAIDWLKTFPVPGWKIVFGQLLGPVLVGSLLQWLALGVIVISTVSMGSLAEDRMPEGPFALVTTSALAIALLVPVFNLAMNVIPTAASLLFPAWFKTGEQTGQGMEMMGVRLLMLLGQLLAVGVALIPAVILGGSTWLALSVLGFSDWSPLGASAAAALTLGTEAALGVRWLGALWDRFDLSEN